MGVYRRLNLTKPSGGGREWETQRDFLNEVIMEISRVSRNFPGPSQAKMEGRKKVSGRRTTLYKILKIKRILYVLQYGWGMNSEKEG